MVPDNAEGSQELETQDPDNVVEPDNVVVPDNAEGNQELETQDPDNVVEPDNVVVPDNAEGNQELEMDPDNVVEPEGAEGDNADDHNATQPFSSSSEEDNDDEIEQLEEIKRVKEMEKRRKELQDLEKEHKKKEKEKKKRKREKQRSADKTKKLKALRATEISKYITKRIDGLKNYPDLQAAMAKCHAEPDGNHPKEFMSQFKKDLEAAHEHVDKEISRQINKKSKKRVRTENAEVSLPATGAASAEGNRTRGEKIIISKEQATDALDEWNSPSKKHGGRDDDEITLMADYLTGMFCTIQNFNDNYSRMLMMITHGYELDSVGKLAEMVENAYDHAEENGPKSHATYLKTMKKHGETLVPSDDDEPMEIVD